MALLGLHTSQPPQPAATPLQLVVVQVVELVSRSAAMRHLGRAGMYFRGEKLPAALRKWAAEELHAVTKLVEEKATLADVVALLARCRAALRAGGAIVIKDNTAAPSECDAGNGNYLLDPGNAAVIRTIAHLRALSKRAGLRVVDAEQQFGFPKELHDVRMYLLMP